MAHRPPPQAIGWHFLHRFRQALFILNGTDGPLVGGSSTHSSASTRGAIISQIALIRAALATTFLVFSAFSAQADVAEPDVDVETTAQADVVEPDVDVEVTVPVGQSQLLQTERRVETAFLAESSIADIKVVSDRAVFVLGKSPGRTTLALIDKSGEVIQEHIVHTVLPLEAVREGLAEGEEELAEVNVLERTRGVEVFGTVRSAAAATRAMEIVRVTLPEGVPLINHLQVTGAQQVNLEVQIAEVRRGVSESLGFNWETIARGSDGIVSFAIGRSLTDPTSGNPFFARQLVNGFPATTIGASTSRGGTQIAGLVDALAEAGLASVLARPNLTAVSGETASFFSGGEYPLPSGYDDGQITFEFKKYGVLLDFVPTIIDHNRISLTVRPEVSGRSETQSITVFGINIPVIEVRRAVTTIEVADGEPFVIAGLYRNNSDSKEVGVPGLKDLPVMGSLFSNRSVRADSTELLILVTARLVGPTVTVDAVESEAGGEDDISNSVRTPEGFHF